MQLIFNKRRPAPLPITQPQPATLLHLSEGEAGVVEALDVPGDIARRLMELGFLPGATVVAARSAPGGDPRVFRVDGSEVALRKETAARIRLQRNAPAESQP